MRRVLVCIVVAVLSGLLVYSRFAPRPVGVLPHPVPPTAPPEAPVLPQASAPAPIAERSVSSSAPLPLEPPRTTAQKEHDDLEAQRAPFYALLRQEAGAWLTDAQPQRDDGATLDLFAAQGDPQSVQALLAAASQSGAYRYGFRHMRFFLPNPPDSVERYRLGAEASPDANGGWQAFEK